MAAHLNDPIDSNRLASGARLGGARIERLLMRGAMGTLYLAFEEGTELPLAIKAVPLDAHDDASLAAAQGRFHHETLNAVRLRHPAIVITHGAIIDKGVGYVAMELLTGTDLARYTREARLLPEALALDITARVAGALAYAHRAGVVHRDVKPANVMYDPAIDSVKLTDFGLSRAVDSEASRSGVLLGSPAYMAPELLAGALSHLKLVLIHKLTKYENNYLYTQPFVYSLDLLANIFSMKYCNHIPRIYKRILIIY